MKDKLKIAVLTIIVIILVGLIGFVIYNGVSSVLKKTANPIATFEIQDYGTVKMELYPEYAPNTVSNFIALIEAGYYNNKVIFGKDDVSVYMARVNEEEDSIAPTVSLIDSSVEKDSEEDYKYEINGEFISNKFEQNTLRHEKGVITLNRSDYSSYGLTEESYNSGSAQFSIIMNDATELNGVYCGFGRVVEGLDIIEKIYNENELKQVETEEDADGHDHEQEIKEFSSKPVITNATIEKNGVEYGKPDIHKAFDLEEYMNELYSSYYSN